MLNIYQNDIVDKLAHLAISTDFVQESDFRKSRYTPLDKTRFDIYVTLCYLGFFNVEQLSLAELVRETPERFYPCDAEFRDSFSVTPASLSRTVKQFTPFIATNIEASANDIAVLSELQLMMPMTLNQINEVMLNSGVCNREVSARAILFLLETFGGSSLFTPVLFYLKSLSRESGSRSGRNSLPSISVIGTEDMKKSLTNLSSSIPRICEWLEHEIGIVDFDFASQLLLTFNRELIAKLDREEHLIRDLCFSVCRSIYDDKTASFAISGSLSNSSIYMLLWKYLDLRESIAIEDIPRFMSRVVNFLAQGKKPTITDKGARLSYPNIQACWDEQYLTTSGVSALLESFDFVLIRNDRCHLDRSVDVFYEPDVPVAVNTLTSYLSRKGMFATGLDTEEKVSVLLSEYSASFRRELLSAISDPLDFFEKGEGDQFSISPESVRHANKYSGKFVQPDADLLSDEMHALRLYYEESISERTANFIVLSELIKNTYSSLFEMLTSHRIPTEAKEDFVKVRKEFLSTSDYTKSLSSVTFEINDAKFKLNSLNSHLRYLESLSAAKSKNAHSIDQTHMRIKKWETVLNKLLEDRELITNSEPYLDHLAYKQQMSELTRKRSSLAINPHKYRAYLLLHRFIGEALDVLNEKKNINDAEFNHSIFFESEMLERPTTSVSGVSLMRFVDIYCSNLKQLTPVRASNKAVGEFNNLRSRFKFCIEEHPFALPVD